MERFLALILLVGIVAVNGSEDVCYNTTFAACQKEKGAIIKCNSILGGFKHSEQDLRAYANLNLAASYKYLLLGSYFNNYQASRDGFYKLFRSLSDKTFDKAIDLIKHITKRGGSVDLNWKQEDPKDVETKAQKLEVYELQSLAMLLDTEKMLAEKAHRIHKHASGHRNDLRHYDPEVAQYLEENFLEEQTERIRKISGYSNDLAKMLLVPDPSLSIFLFDQYLQKQ